MSFSSQAMRPDKAGDPDAEHRMPLPVKLLSYAIALALGSVAFWVVMTIAGSESKLWLVSLATLLVVAAIGLLRRLVWGRVLVSFLGFATSFFLLSLLIPVPDDNIDGGPLLQQLLGFMPPTWVAWLCIVLVSSVPLVLATVVSWRRGWFRGAIW